MLQNVPKQGYPLHTASGAFSPEIAGYLQGMECSVTLDARRVIPLSGAGHA